MKTLKITLIVTLFISVLASCTKEELNDDDVLVDPVVQTAGDRDDDDGQDTGGN